MAKDFDPVWDLVNDHLGEMVVTPAGTGEVAGLADRNDHQVLLVDRGERLPGFIPVLAAFQVVRLADGGLRVDAMARAAKVARKGAMESGARREGAMES